MAIEVINIPKNTWVELRYGYFSFQVLGDRGVYYTKAQSMPVGTPPHEVPSKFALSKVQYNYREDLNLDTLYVYTTSKNGTNIAIDSPNYDDVYVQDQTTPPIEYFLTRYLNDVVITSTALAKTRVINLQAGHGFQPQDFIEIYTELPVNGFFKRFEQLRVVSVTATSITVGQYLGIDINPADVVFSRRVTADLNVDGSVTEQRFSLGAPNGLKWDLTRTIGSMILSGQPDDGLFGNLPALTNGIFFGFENDITQQYLVNIIANAGLRATAYDVTYTTRTVPLGSYGVTYRKSFSGQDKFGVAIRLEGFTNDEFVCYVQDDLTGLIEFRIKVMGHEVE